MIREAKHSDINIINELGEKLLNNFSKTYDIISYINNKDYIFLVNQDKEINAFLLVRKNLNDFELEYIIVKEDWRNQGIASNLLNYFLTKYCSNDSSIFLEVDCTNEQAIKLYEKFDFKIVNIRKKYYDGKDAYVMKRVV